MTRSIFATLAEQYDPERNYVLRPVEWCRDKTKIQLWSKQRQIMESVRDNRYTAAVSAHDLGKSKIAAEIMAWWIDSHPIGEAFVVSTAPSAAQVSAILWREVSKSHRIAKLFGKINRAGYPQWFYESELIGYGRKPADYEDSAFQGIHAKYVLVVIDEACGVSKSLYDQIDALVTNQHCRVLAIGNPDNPGSHFASICTPGHKANSGWNVIHLDGLHSPNMTRSMIVGPDPENPTYPALAALMEAEGIDYVDPEVEVVPDELREYLLSPLWVEERIQRWAGVSDREIAELTHDDLKDTVQRRCAASSLFTAKVRGVFPPSTLDGVIPLAWIQFAMQRWRRWMDAGGDTRLVPNPTRHVIGVDVARGGEDETVFAFRYGDMLTKLMRMRVADTTETADALHVHCHVPKMLTVIDVIGIGSGVFDMTRKARRKGLIEAAPVQFVASAATWRVDAIGAFKFRNDRSAAWWKMRELLDPSRGSKIGLPDDDRLLEELVAPRWVHLANGVISVETKDDIKRRLGRSTDTADAVIQAFWPSGRVFSDPDSYSDVDSFKSRAALPRSNDVFYPEGYRPVSSEDVMVSAGQHKGVASSSEMSPLFEDAIPDSYYGAAAEGFRDKTWAGSIVETTDPLSGGWDV